MRLGLGIFLRGHVYEIYARDASERMPFLILTLSTGSHMPLPLGLTPPHYPPDPSNLSLHDLDQLESPLDVVLTPLVAVDSLKWLA